MQTLSVDDCESSGSLGSIGEIINTLQRKLKNENSNDTKILIKNEILEKIRTLVELVNQVMVIDGDVITSFVIAKSKVKQLEKSYFLTGHISKDDMIFMNSLWILCNERLAEKNK